MQSWSPGAVRWGQTYYEKAGQPGADWLRLAVLSYRRFVDMRAVEASAAMAYFALFSFFPLTLVLVSIFGYLIGSELAYTRVVEFIHSLVPFSGSVLDENLQNVIKLRGPVGIIGLLGLLWAASGFFDTLSHSINRAWPMLKLRSYVQNRLVALAMIGGLVLLLMLSLASSALLALLPLLFQSLLPNAVFTEPNRWSILLRFVPALFTLMMFVALYLWVPNKNVHWRAALPGALITTTVWELAKLLFSTFIGSGRVRYELVYGSLGALIALMLWVYFGGLVALFGAYLVASLDQWLDLQAIEQQRRLQEQQRQQSAAEVLPAPDTSGNGHQPAQIDPGGIQEQPDQVEKEGPVPRRVRG